MASSRCRLVPTAELIGADGAPIGVGDIVYRDADPEPLQVDLIYAGSMGYCTVRLKDSAGIYTSADAPRLSHKKPEPADSWEKLEEDIRRIGTDDCTWFCGYANENPVENACPDSCKFFKGDEITCRKKLADDILSRIRNLRGEDNA